MYNDPVIKKVISLIEAHNPGLKMFYQGDPIKIPASNLPCCIVSKVGTRTDFSDSANDEHEMVLHITVVADIRGDLSTAEDIAKIAPGVAKLYDIVEGRNADYSLKSTSILDIIRTNSLIDAGNNLRFDLHTVTRVDYGSTMRNRNPAEWSLDATIEVVVNFIQLR